MCAYYRHCAYILLKNGPINYEKLYYNSKGLLPLQIVSALKVDDIHTTRQTVAWFLR